MVPTSTTIYNSNKPALPKMLENATVFAIAHLNDVIKVLPYGNIISDYVIYDANDVGFMEWY